MLRHQRQIANETNGAARLKSSPFLAVVLSLVCPGLGAAYNGQNSKALAHFGVFVGLFQMAILTNGAPLFVLGFLGMWLFAAVDAFRTARAIKFGLNPATDDALTKKLAGNSLVWAISLIVLGTLFTAKTFFGFDLPVRELLAILLIGLGVYRLVNYYQRKRSSELTAADAFANHLPPFDEATYTSVNAARVRAGKFGN